jgi:hypothetical protein
VVVVVVVVVVVAANHPCLWTIAAFRLFRIDELECVECDERPVQPLTGIQPGAFREGLLDPVVDPLAGHDHAARLQPHRIPRPRLPRLASHQSTPTCADPTHAADALFGQVDWVAPGLSRLSMRES